VATILVNDIASVHEIALLKFFPRIRSEFVGSKKLIKHADHSRFVKLTATATKRIGLNLI